MRGGAFAGFSLLLLVAEQVARFCATLRYFLAGQLPWGWATLALLLPGYLAQGLSFVWFQADGHQTSGSLVLIHLMQLGIWKRYWDALWSALKAGESPEMKEHIMQQGDLAVLQLLDSLVRTLPNLLLQAYSCAVMEAQGVVSGLSAGFSLLSFCWALVSYSRFAQLVRPGHLCMPGAAFFCQLLWRTGMIGSRVLTLIFFAKVYRLWVFVAAGVHWLMMSYWAVTQHTDIFRSPCHWRILNFLTGAVYIFCYISFKEGPSLYRVTVYYIMMALENSLLLLMLVGSPQGNLRTGQWLIGAVASGFIVGLAALGTYYTWLHPKSAEIWQDFLKRVCNAGPKDTKTTGKSAHQSSKQTIRSSGISRWQNTKELSTETATPSLGMAHNSSLVELGSWGDVSNPCENHHHWLLVKLALKTGDISKINAAFGEGGTGELYHIAVAEQEDAVAKLGTRKKLIFCSESKAIGKDVLAEEDRTTNCLSSSEEGTPVALPAVKPIAAETPLHKLSPVINPTLETPSASTDLNGMCECHSGRWRDTVRQDGHGKSQEEQQRPLHMDSSVYFTASLEMGCSNEECQTGTGVFAHPAKNIKSDSPQNSQVDKEGGFLTPAANLSPIPTSKNLCLRSSPVCCLQTSFNISTPPEFADQRGMLRSHCNSSDINLFRTWVAVLKGNRGDGKEPQRTSTPKLVTTSRGYAF